MATTIGADGVSTDGLKIASTNVPATPTSAGTKGQIEWDENFLYICITDNVWARTNISIYWEA